MEYFDLIYLRIPFSLLKSCISNRYRCWKVDLTESIRILIWLCASYSITDENLSLSSSQSDQGRSNVDHVGMAQRQAWLIEVIIFCTTLLTLCFFRSLGIESLGEKYQKLKLKLTVCCVMTCDRAYRVPMPYISSLLPTTTSMVASSLQHKRRW